jgi:hypothetical protein
MQKVILHPTEDRWQKTEASKNNGLRFRPCAKNAGKRLFAQTSDYTGHCLARNNILAPAQQACFVDNLVPSFRKELPCVFGGENWMMDISEIQRHVLTDQYEYTLHADIERKNDDLTFEEIEVALLSGEILEFYPDTGRGESCLIVCFSHNIPIHVVCGWRDAKLYFITVYVPKPPKFITP